jgi:hypothetical protein
MHSYIEAGGGGGYLQFRLGVVSFIRPELDNMKSFFVASFCNHTHQQMKHLDLVYLNNMFQLSTLNWVSLNFKFPGKEKIKQILPATKFVIATSINKAFMRN